MAVACNDCDWRGDRWDCIWSVPRGSICPVCKGDNIVDARKLDDDIHEHLMAHAPDPEPELDVPEDWPDEPDEDMPHYDTPGGY